MAEKAQCARESIDLKSIEFFEISMPKGKTSRKVQDPALLMEDPETYQLIADLYPYLKDPPPILYFLMKKVLDLRGEEKLTLILSDKTSREQKLIDQLLYEHAGRYEYYSKHKKLGKILLFSDLKRTNEYGTIVHEVGHALMHALYGYGRPSNKPSHDHDKTKDRLDEETNPDTAWREGFANGIQAWSSSMPAVFPLEIHDSNWKDKKIKERLSNEYVIGSILYSFITSRLPNEEFKLLGKIAFCMQYSSHHDGFQAFAKDFLLLFPEESEKFLSILEDHGLRDMISAKDGIEHYVTRYVNKDFPKQGLFRRIRWNQLKRSHQLDFLENPDLSHNEKLSRLQNVENQIRAKFIKAKRLSPTEENFQAYFFSKHEKIKASIQKTLREDPTKIEIAIQQFDSLYDIADHLRLLEDQGVVNRLKELYEVILLVALPKMIQVAEEALRERDEDKFDEVTNFDYLVVEKFSKLPISSTSQVSIQEFNASLIRMLFNKARQEIQNYNGNKRLKGFKDFDLRYFYDGKNNQEKIFPDAAFQKRAQQTESLIDI